MGSYLPPIHTVSPHRTVVGPLGAGETIFGGACRYQGKYTPVPSRRKVQSSPLCPLSENGKEGGREVGREGEREGGREREEGVREVANSKVGNLDVVLGVQEKVFWFQITVNYLMTVCVHVCVCVCVCVCEVCGE